MRKNRFALVTGLALTVLPAAAADGMIQMKSAHSVKASIDRLEALVKDKGMTIFARIDHAAGAEQAGENLRPTELLIFGSPKVGTALMHCRQSLGMDLPLKALAWRDENGQVWIAYNDVTYLAQRHGVPGCAPVPKVQKAVSGFIEAAAAP